LPKVAAVAVFLPGSSPPVLLVFSLLWWGNLCFSDQLHVVARRAMWAALVGKNLSPPVPGPQSPPLLNMVFEAIFFSKNSPAPATFRGGRDHRMPPSTRYRPPPPPPPFFPAPLSVSNSLFPPLLTSFTREPVHRSFRPQFDLTEGRFFLFFSLLFFFGGLLSLIFAPHWGMCLVVDFRIILPPAIRGIPKFCAY